MKIELDTSEATVLLTMIDLAVKSAGIPAAEAGLHFTKKINAALEAEKAPAEDVS